MTEIRPVTLVPLAIRVPKDSGSPDSCALDGLTSTVTSIGVEIAVPETGP